jgi:hypothetical protein
VAIYSDADSEALHVREADEAVRIGPPPSAESYLKIDAVIEACRKTGAEAVHPGYGFLSENAAFATALDKAGIVFIGPPAEVALVARDVLEAAGHDPAAAPRAVRDTGERPRLVEAGEPVAIISHQVWQTRFAADPSGIGRSVRVGGEPVEIYRHRESAHVGALSHDGTLLAIEHTEHGDAMHEHVLRRRPFGMDLPIIDRPRMCLPSVPVIEDERTDRIAASEGAYDHYEAVVHRLRVENGESLATIRISGHEVPRGLHPEIVAPMIGEIA